MSVSVVPDDATSALRRASGTPGSVENLRTNYDENPYFDQAFPEFDAARQLGFAQLFGLADPSRTCEGMRVLDLGCASGLHLRDQARRYPNVSFVGVDNAAAEIEIGRKVIASEGLDNVELVSADLLDFEIETGAYDLISCHGVFSWVPDGVKERILQLCRMGLAQGGIAAIAYLTYPGWKQREAVRELLAMRDHAGRPAEERVRESALMLRFLRASYASCGEAPHARSYAAIVEGMQKSSSNAFLHDELGPIHDPCYFLQFVDWAAECGLQYLAETNLGSMSAHGLEAEASDLLAALSPDFNETQQLIDFVLNRSGRSSMLVRSDAVPTLGFDSKSLEALGFGTRWWHVTPHNAPSDAPTRFESDRGQSLETQDRCVEWLLVRLTTIRDESVPYEALAAEGRSAGHASDVFQNTLKTLLAKGIVEPRAARG